MSDFIKHECGIAFIRLLKPLDYYIDKYGSPLYGLNKLYLLMEKQHNRGQDGAGVATVTMDVEPGYPFISRERSVDSNPIISIFNKIQQGFRNAYEQNKEHYHDAKWVKNNVPFAGELLLGHLRYGTYGKNSINSCHPFIRQNNWPSRNLVLAGNFNMTNNDELFNLLVNLGQHPRDKKDTVTVLEKIGHFLDEENERLYQKFKDEGYSKKEISPLIAQNTDVEDILKKSASDFDGGYAMAGLIGHGDAFILRDPNGIRPAFYYADDEVVVAASERPAIRTTFNIPFEEIKEITPGSALIVRKNGEVFEKGILPKSEKLSCTFERIYFSRGTDEDIYKERKVLGRLLTEKVLKAIDFDHENTVFSYVPNTAETAFYGLVKGVEKYLQSYKVSELSNKKVDGEELNRLINLRPRVEKIIVKDAKLRTFITDDDHRNELVAHVYDSTYGVIRPGIDSLVIVDDSIVRGTTLKQSILSIINRLKPRKVVVVSSAPQIRYPDCYGIDMSKMNDFVAFRAAVNLLKAKGKMNVLDEVYSLCRDNPEANENYVKRIYEAFTDDEISKEIAAIVTPSFMECEVEVIFQSIENLHKACPNHSGDWYFSGNFPTKGGNNVVNRAFVNYYEGKNERAY